MPQTPDFFTGQRTRAPLFVRWAGGQPTARAPHLGSIGAARTPMGVVALSEMFGQYLIVVSLKF